MEKRRIENIANIVICAVICGILFISTLPQSASVSGNEPIYKGQSISKVSLMINVYWGTEYVDGMLDVLERCDVKTTFFVGGMWIAENASTAQKIVEKGHELGNHGYFHKDHSKLSYEQNIHEIKVTHEIVKSTVGVSMNLFAPPSGAFNQTTIEAAVSLNYTTIMWTKDTVDWRDKDENIIYRRATEGIEGGALILMHPTECTLAVLEDIIKTLSRKGLRVCPVTEVLNRDVVSL